MDGAAGLPGVEDVALPVEDALGEDEDAADHGVIGGGQANLNVGLGRGKTFNKTFACENRYFNKHAIIINRVPSLKLAQVFNIELELAGQDVFRSAMFL